MTRLKLKDQRDRLVGIFGLAIIELIHFWWLLPFFQVPAQTEKFGAPLVPLLLWLFGLVIPGPESQVKTALVILFLLIQPILIYQMVKKITQRRSPAFLAAFLINLPIWWWAARVRSALVFGDAAHIIALVFFPIIGVEILKFLRLGKFKDFLLSLIGTALLTLTSSFASLMFFFFGLILTFSEILLGFGRVKFLRFISVLLGTGGLAAFWYNPILLREVFVSQRGQELFLVFSRLVPISIVLLPLLGSVGFLLFEKKPQLQPLFLALSLFVLYFLFYLIGLSGSRVLATEPERFLPEVGWSLAFLLGVVLDKLSFRLRRAKKIGKVLCLDSGLRFGSLLVLWIGMMMMVQILAPSRALAEEMVFLDAPSLADFEHLSLAPWNNYFGLFSGILLTLTTLGILAFISEKIKFLKS